MRWGGARVASLKGLVSCRRWAGAHGTEGGLGSVQAIRLRRKIRREGHVGRWWRGRLWPNRLVSWGRVPDQGLRRAAGLCSDLFQGVQHASRAGGGGG